MAKPAPRFLVRNIAWNFLEKTRREPTLIEGFILGLICLTTNIGYYPVGIPEKEIEQKRRKIKLLLGLIYDEVGFEFFEGNKIYNNNDIVIDFNVVEFDGGFFESNTYDLTKFRSSLQIEYKSMWAKDMSIICNNVISIKKLVGSNDNHQWTNHQFILFGMGKEVSADERGMTALFLGGLEQMVLEIKKAAFPSVLVRMARWWTKRRKRPE